MGGNVRTGLEDIFYYRKGEMVKSNAQLVKRMLRLARELGRETATIDEARQILGLKEKKKKIVILILDVFLILVSFV